MLVKSVYVIICCILVVMPLISGCNSRQRNELSSSSLSTVRVVDKPAVLAIIPEDTNVQSLIPVTGAEAHAPTSSINGVVFADKGGSVAYTAEKDGMGYVVHNGKPDQLYNAFGAIVFSPDGSRIAYSAQVADKWCLVADGVAGPLYDEIREPKFSPDSRHLIYQYKNDDLYYLVVDKNVTKGSKTFYRTPQFSGDYSRLIFIDSITKKDAGRLVVCNPDFSNEVVLGSFVTDFYLNADKTAVAAISRTLDGKERVIQFSIDKPGIVSSGPVFDKVKHVAFADSGSDLMYFGERQKATFGVFNGREEALPKGFTPRQFGINKSSKYVGVLTAVDNAVFLYQMFKKSGKLYSQYDEAEGLVYSSDGALSAFDARTGENWFVVVNGIKGPDFDRVVTPKFSPDNKFLVYRARKDGKRFVVVADASGKIVRLHPKYEQVFDVQFTADGTSVAYGVKDGNQLAWKVEKL